MLTRFLHNHVMANLAFALVLVLGWISYQLMPREQDPEINFNWIDITTILPGATAADVETRVTDVLEDAIRNVADIKFVSSTSASGVSSILVRFEEIDERTFDKRVNDLRREIQARNPELPEETVDPQVTEITTDNAFPSAIIAVTGPADDENLRRRARTVKEDLERMEGVNSVLASGLRDPELRVDFDVSRLDSLGVSPLVVADTVAAYYQDISAGRIAVGEESWLVRLRGTSPDPQYLADVPIQTANGELRLGDVANVARARSKAERLVNIDDRPAVLLSITKKAGTNMLELVERVIDYVEERNRLSAVTGVSLVLVDDQTEITRNALRIMQNNAVIGLLLVLVVTWLFLGNRISLITCIGIPFILAATFWLLASLGFTLNVTVLLGVVISLGMLVDDAVVVAEAIFYRLQRGVEVTRATIDSLREVFAPVTTAVLTTMAAFLPLMLLPGILGKFMLVIPLVVTSALAISLVEAYWMLPVHVIGGGVAARPRTTVRERLFARAGALLARRRRNRVWWALTLIVKLPWAVLRLCWALLREVARAPLRVLDAVDAWVAPRRARAIHWIRLRYTQLLVKALRRPRLTLGVTALLGIFSLSFLFLDALPEKPPQNLAATYSTWGFSETTAGSLADWTKRSYPRATVAWLRRHAIKYDFFASDPIRLFYVNMEMPIGTPLGETMSTLRSLEASLRERIEPEELRAIVGYSGIMFTETAALFGDRYGQLAVSLNPKTPALRSVSKVIAAVRPTFDRVIGPQKLSIIKMAGGPPTTKPISTKVRGTDLERIREAADALKQRLAEYDELRDITDDATPGQYTMTATLNNDAIRRAGMNPLSVSRAFRLLVDGEVVASLQDQGEKLEVRVRALDRELTDIDELLSLRLPNEAGGVPLRELVQVAYARTPEVVRHYNYRRTVTVEADIDKTRTDTLAANALVREAWAGLQADYPELSIDQSGLLDDLQESLDAIGVLFLFGLGLMYLILGTQFRSYYQPLMILVAVPLAGIGVVLGLIISGNPLSLYTLYGIVALAGIAVNAAIVLISAANARLAAGMSVLHATLYAARRRVVPILITSLTTIAGLFSLATGLGGKSLLWGPVAAAIVWGLMFSTVLTLVVVPLLYRSFMVNSQLARRAAAVRQSA